MVMEHGTIICQIQIRQIFPQLLVVSSYQYQVCGRLQGTGDQLNCPPLQSWPSSIAGWTSTWMCRVLCDAVSIDASFETVGQQIHQGVNGLLVQRWPRRSTGLPEFLRHWLNVERHFSCACQCHLSGEIQRWKTYLHLFIGDSERIELFHLPDWKHLQALWEFECRLSLPPEMRWRVKKMQRKWSFWVSLASCTCSRFSSPHIVLMSVLRMCLSVPGLHLGSRLSLFKIPERRLM